MFSSKSLAFGSIDAVYSKEDSVRVVNLLTSICNYNGKEPLTLYFGKKLLNVSYVPSTLEVGGYERLVVNLHQLDCTTFVETVVALTICAKKRSLTFDDYCMILKKLRYWGGEIKDYSSRLHYFTWWGIDNQAKGLIKEVSCEDALFSSCQVLDVDYMSTKPHLYKHLKSNPVFQKTIHDYEVKYNGRKFYYLPKHKLKYDESRLSSINTGDIIAIVTNKNGLDISHVGFAVWINGKLHLMHASSLKRKVIIDDLTLYEYSMKQKSNLGMRVFRVIDE